MPARAKGVLGISSRPWSQVYVDGRMVGFTPQTALALEPGPHVVRLISPEFGLEKTFTVQIRGGETITRAVDLE